MDAETEFTLKYATAENALQLARKAFRKYGTSNVGQHKGFIVELMGLAVLKMSGVQAAWVEAHALVRSTSLGAQTPSPWIATKNPLMQSLAGTLDARTDEGVRSSDLTGFRAVFTCGERKVMHDLPVDVPASHPSLPESFQDCVGRGMVQNEKLRKQYPGAPYLESEVVVRVTLSSLPTCFLQVDASKISNQNETKNPVYQSFSSISGCQEMPDVVKSSLPRPLSEEVDGSDPKFRGILAGKGLPDKVLYEVLLDPVDFSEEVGLSSGSSWRNFLCVALDRAARRAMRKRKFHTLKDAIWKMRWLVLHTFAHLGIDGLVLDSDIVVLQDPFPALWGDADFEVMTDHFWPEQHLWQYWTRPEEHINTGCIFVEASDGVWVLGFDKFRSNLPGQASLWWLAELREYTAEGFAGRGEQQFQARTSEMSGSR
eukprot:s4781_g1.t4